MAGQFLLDRSQSRVPFPFPEVRACGKMPRVTPPIRTHQRVASFLASAFDILVEKPLRFLDRSNPKFEARNSKQIRRTKIQNTKTGSAFADGQAATDGHVLVFGFQSFGIVSDFGFRASDLRVLISNSKCLWLLLLWMAASTAWTAVPLISIVTDPKPSPPVRHALDALVAALKSKSISFERATDPDHTRGTNLLVIGIAPGKNAAGLLLREKGIEPPDFPEGLLLQRVPSKNRDAWLVAGGDDRGLMYVLYDVADRILAAPDASRPLSELRDLREKPDAPQRALSIYTMQQKYFEQRLFAPEYWERYFELLARNRFNSFVLIFGYENAGYMTPAYPYFFDVEGFSEVRVVGFHKQSRYRQALRRLIEQAHQHGLSVTMGLWDHIYRGGVQAGGVRIDPNEPTAGNVWGLSRTNLMAYSEAALAKFIRVFPGVDGLQFRMHSESGLKPGAEMEEFWSRIYDVVKASGKPLRFDARAKDFPDSLIDLAIAKGIPLRICTKYWMEQMGLPFHPTHINLQNQFDRRHGYADLLRYPQRYKMHWRLWNAGATRVLLWGDPEYARRFVESTHLYDGDGFEVNEPLATKMASHHGIDPFDLLTPKYQYYDFEFERYWHFFQVFGRVGYNPQTAPEVWHREFQRRFGPEAGPELEAALHLASGVLPRIVAVCFPYHHFPTTRGWAEKQRQDDLPVYAKVEPTDTQQFQSVEQAARYWVDGGDSARISPLQTSQWFARVSREISDRVDAAERKIGPHPTKEFISTRTDLHILANLALYHSRRLQAGLHWSLFELTHELNSADHALQFERDSISAWEQLVAAAGDVYTTNLMMGLASAGLAGHWRDELPLFERGWLALRERVRQAQENLGKEKSFLAHVPVRRLLPGRDLMLEATCASCSGPDDLRVNYRSQDGPPREISFQRVGDLRFRAIVPAREVHPGFSYVIEQRNGDGRAEFYPRNRKPISVVVSADRDPPLIRHQRVRFALPDRPLRIRATVSDPAGVSSVRVRFRSVNQKFDYETLEMEPTGRGGQYAAVIPGEKIPARWDFMYFIEATDRDGNGRIFPDLETETPYIVVPLDRSGLAQ